jgi:hypothetical protein
MDKRLKKYYYAVILNMILWFAVAAQVVHRDLVTQPASANSLSTISIVGCILAALLQHCAYYDFKNTKTRLTTSAPNEARNG